MVRGEEMVGMSRRLVAGLIVHNEADRYLGLVLNSLETYCDAICILDDGSTDATPEICARRPRTRVVRNPRSIFWDNESALRTQLWQLVLEAQPDWILAIDADEVLEASFAPNRDRYLEQDQHPLIGVQLYPLWGSATHYRVDKLWNPVGRYTPMFVRHHPGFPYRWRPRRLHCGRIPTNVPGPVWQSGLRARHFGYANPADHRRKHDLYLRHDPHGMFCALSHYQSILDPPSQVRLLPWRD